MEFYEVIKKAWADPNYKMEFLKNPQQVLEREGCDIDIRGKLFAHEAKENEIHLVLPLEDKLKGSNVQENGYFALIKKARSDPSFKKEFIENPKAVLKNAGLDISKNENVKIIVHENTDNETHIILPQENRGELSDEELEAISGGFEGIFEAIGYGAKALWERIQGGYTSRGMGTKL